MLDPSELDLCVGATSEASMPDSPPRDTVSESPVPGGLAVTGVDVSAEECDDKVEMYSCASEMSEDEDEGEGEGEGEHNGGVNKPEGRNR
jgi:hypothetical protein